MGGKGVGRIQATREVAWIKVLLTDPNMPQPHNVSSIGGADNAMHAMSKGMARKNKNSKLRSGSHGVQRTMQSRLKWECMHNARE